MNLATILLKKNNKRLFLQSCTAITEECELIQNTTDPHIECNNATADRTSSITMQHKIACNETLSSCSTIDGLSADILQVRDDVLGIAYQNE